MEYPVETNEVLQHQSESKSSSTSFEKSTSHIPIDNFSLFGDSSCGEPLFTQHLVIDFTPTDEDSDYVQKKCCDFWTFIHNQPEIQNLKVFPETNEYSKVSDTSNYTSDTDRPEIEKPVELDRTAVSMLEIVEEKGLIDRTFEAKLPQSMCTLGSREYKELEEVTQQKKKKKSGIPGASARPRSSIATKTMVKKMQEWDMKHPKSMDPPSHPPSLQHCVMPPNVHYY